KAQLKTKLNLARNIVLADRNQPEIWTVGSVIGVGRISVEGPEPARVDAPRTGRPQPGRRICASKRCPPMRPTPASKCFIAAVHCPTALPPYTLRTSPASSRGALPCVFRARYGRRTPGGRSLNARGRR